MEDTDNASYTGLSIQLKEIPPQCSWRLLGMLNALGRPRLRRTENNSAQFQPAQLSIDQERSENATNDASLHESIEDSTGYDKPQGQRRTEYSVCNLWIAFSPTKNCIIKNTSIRHIFSSDIIPTIIYHLISAILFPS